MVCKIRNKNVDLLKLLSAKLTLIVVFICCHSLFLTEVSQAAVTFTSDQPPTIVGFYTIPSTAEVLSGQSIDLKWEVSNAMQCYVYKGHMLINNGTGQSIAIDEAGNKLVAPIWNKYLPSNGDIVGQLTVNPQETGEYTLICASDYGVGPPRNERGISLKRVLITVNDPVGNSGCPVSCKPACASDESKAVDYTCSDQSFFCCVKSAGQGSGSPGSSSVPTTLSTSGALLNLPNPLAFTTVPSLITTLLTSLQKIIVTLALIFIVIGAFFYLTSGGNDSRMEAGKKTILAAVVGLALGIAAPAFLKEIAAILGWSGYTPLAGVGTTLSFYEILFNILSFLLTIIGIITIIMMVIGGMMYLTAAGNEDQIDKGKKIVKYSLIGITIALAALVLVKQVAKFFVG